MPIESGVRPSRTPRPWTIAAGLAIAAIAGGSQFLLERAGSEIPALLLPFLAVLAAAFVLGLWGGLAALLAGAVSTLMLPISREHPDRVYIFLFAGTAIVLIAEAYRRAASNARIAEERYRAFIDNSTEGIYRLEFDPPIDLSLPEERVLELAYERGRLAECNRAFARMYGHSDHRAMIGLTMSSMLPREDPRSIEWGLTIIRSGFRIADAESVERHKDGGEIYFSNTLQGVIENGTLVRLWGTQRETSQRRRMEAELGSERALLRSTIDASPNLIFVKDDRGRFLLANKAFADLYGTTPREVVGKRDEDLIPSAAERQRFNEQDLRVISTRTTLNIAEETVTDSTGAVRWFATVKVPLIEPDGSCSRLLGIASDITLRRRAEEQLGQSEDRFRAVFNQQYQFMSLLSTEGRVIDVNDLPLKAIGAQRGSIVGQFFWDTPWWRDLPDMRREWPRRLERAARADTPMFSEDRYQDVSGEIRTADCAITAVRGRDGAVEFFIVQASDTTQRRKAEAHLRESEERFRTLADNISQLAWMADAEGAIFWYNQRWYDFTGTASSEMLGWGWKSVHHPEHIDRVVEKFRRHIAEGRNWEDTFPLRGRGGEYRWFLSRALPIRGEDGRIIRWFGTNTDITEQMRTQEELQRLTDSLRAANADLLQFASIASHDLKEPLRGISHLAAFIEQDASALGRDAGPRLARIQALCARLSQMVDGLLLFSRLGAEPLFQPCDLNEVIAKVADTSAEPIAFDGATLTVRGTLPTVRGDPVLLERAFANLISNAVKFNDAPDKRVEIFSEGDEVLVRDNGIGIDPRHHETIFRVFRRAHNSDRYAGTGLGLALVKRIIERHDGRVHLESAPGRGSTFRIALPVISPGADGPERVLIAPSHSRPVSS